MRRLLYINQSIYEGQVDLVCADVCADHDFFYFFLLQSFLIK